MSLATDCAPTRHLALEDGAVHDVHRRPASEATDWTPGPCEVGIPAEEGYTFVGSANGLEAVGFVGSHLRESNTPEWLNLGICQGITKMQVFLAGRKKGTQ